MYLSALCKNSRILCIRYSNKLLCNFNPHHTVTVLTPKFSKRTTVSDMKRRPNSLSDLTLNLNRSRSNVSVRHLDLHEHDDNSFHARHKLPETFINCNHQRLLRSKFGSSFDASVFFDRVINLFVYVTRCLATKGLIGSVFALKSDIITERARYIACLGTRLYGGLIRTTLIFPIEETDILWTGINQIDFGTVKEVSGHCSHIIGLVKTLQGFKLHNFKSVPDELSCTSVPQQWNVPRGLKIKPSPVNRVIVARPTENRKRKPVLCQFDLNYKIPKVTSADISVLSAMKGTPFESRNITLDIPSITTPLGQFKLGSLLSYQSRHLEADVYGPTDQTCGNISINNKSPILLPEEFKHLNINNHYDDPVALENNTKKQSASGIWYKERQKRLTASNFGKVLTRKKTPNISFLSSIFKGESCQISAPSLDYGKQHESEAKSVYMAKYPSKHVHLSGLVVNNEFSFLGATPDGKMCDNGSSGIVEIKCPYTARNLTIDKAVEDNQIIFLRKIENELITLKETHPYYAQIQGQLMITGCDFCEFIVFTQKDIFVQRIKPDIDFMKDMLFKLATFYRDYAVAYLNSL